MQSSLDELDLVRLVLNTDHLLSRLVVNEATLGIADNGANRGAEPGVPGLDGQSGIEHCFPFRCGW
jgi:hypothetical protein